MGKHKLIVRIGSQEKNVRVLQERFDLAARRNAVAVGQPYVLTPT